MPLNGLAFWFEASRQKLQKSVAVAMANEPRGRACEDGIQWLMNPAR